jgi:hypothetical protein
VTAGLQDSSREWITVLATVCADGSAIDSGVIFEAKGELCSGWVHNVEVGEHQVFFTTILAWPGLTGISTAYRMQSAVELPHSHCRWSQQLSGRRSAPTTPCNQKVHMINEH